MKKVLYITHLSGRRVNRFWLSSIQAAQELGYEFHLACNMSDAEHPFWDEECASYHIVTHQIDFNRNPLSIDNINAARQLTRLLKDEQFGIVHCNTPVGGLIGRVCAKRAKVPRIIYQAHGFHFWKGAPLKNWLVYYPVEKWLSRKTDVLITINQEDFERAKHFKVKRVVYIPGVGIDTEIFGSNTKRGDELREALEIPSDAIVLLSVGELIKRKNHKIVIETVKNLANVWYVICGQGPLIDEYRVLSSRLGISDRIKLVGFQTDIKGFYDMADIYIFPSYQEGLSVSLMEAMASSLPCIVSNIRGNTDLIKNDDMRFLPDDKQRLTNILCNVIADKGFRTREGNNNKKEAMNFKIEIIVEDLKKIYV